MTETPVRFRLDATVQRFGTTIIGGSPLTLFRVSESGRDAIDRIAAGEAVAVTPLVERLLDAGMIHPRRERGRHSIDDVTVVMPTLGPPTGDTSRAIVVDDGSTPPVAGATVRLDTNRGPAAARNAGLERVTTTLVAFVDADVDLPTGWLDALLPHFDDPRVGAVAPRVRSAADADRVARYERDHSPLDLGNEPARVRAGTRVSYVPAAAIVCRTEAVRSIGGFDDTLRFGEDVDLVWRLDDAGWWCRYEPASVVEHAPRPDWPAWLRQRVGYGSSAGPLARRHRGKLTPLRMSGWSLGAWLLGAVGRPVAGFAVGIGSALALAPKLPDVPPAAAIRIAAVGNARAGEHIAQAVRRAWLPLVVLAATRSRSARAVLIASIMAARHPLVVVDDAAYCAGVWRGMWAARTVDPIVPDIVSWPGGRRRSGQRTRYGPSS